MQTDVKVTVRIGSATVGESWLCSKCVDFDRVPCIGESFDIEAGETPPAVIDGVVWKEDGSAEIFLNYNSDGITPETPTYRDAENFAKRLRKRQYLIIPCWFGHGVGA